MKKENIWLIISILLVIIWMVSVFKLSGEVSEVSGNRSGGIISSIIRFFNNDISEDKLEKLTESLQPFVRKCAHFCLYAIGGFLIYNLVNMQLDKMPSWNIESISLNGKDSHNYTYTYPKQKLYVMEPDINSVNEAIAKIDEIENPSTKNTY